MANIHGTASGLVAGDIPEPRKPKVVKDPLIEYCECCQGRLPRRRGATRFVAVEGTCVPCISFFGDDDRPGCTNLGPDDTKKKLADLKQKEWGLILRAGSYGTSSGLTINIEPGDIFKVTRVGLEQDSGEEQCSQERTKEMFSVSINLGPIPLVLFPHEISAISFVTIMEMKRAGEIEEAYVSSNDEVGHFRPNQALRDQIYAAFGHLVNAPGTQRARR